MKIINTIFILVLISIHVVSQETGNDSLTQEWNRMHKTKDQALKEFNEAKFSMFIHWGVYSLPAGIWKGEKIPRLGEWIMYRAGIPPVNYYGLQIHGILHR